MMTVLKVEGMTCGNCARKVREALQAATGGVAVEVDLDSGTARVPLDNAQSAQSLLDALKAAGYPATVMDGPEKKSASAPGSAWRFNVLLGSAMTLPLLAGGWLFHWDIRPWFPWLSFAMILPVQFIAGARFYRGAWQQARSGNSNMDTLVALGSTTAFGFSVFTLFTSGHPHHLYFTEAGAIITLISLGHYLEARAGERAAVAVKALLALAPETALRVGPDGKTETVPVAALKSDDRVALHPGDRIPTDGTVEHGHGTVDESMLTGESIPVAKKEGDPLYAGTVNLDGALALRVTAAGEATALARIIRIVERAQTSRAGIERLADRVSSVFVPVVVLVALATVAGWGLLGGDWAAGIIHAAGVLIVACPCAMGLATPAAIMAGANAAARRGILIRDGLALEKCGHITAVLFDKTGTLTAGQPRVTRTECLNGKEAEFRALARSLAAPSKHPYSRAVAEFFSGEQLLEIQDWREERGAGVSGMHGGKQVQLGSVRWLAESGVPLPTTPESGGTVLGVASDGRLTGVLALEDPLKPDAANIVKQLRDAGLSVHLVTGDAVEPARRIAAEAGIPAESVFAGIRPGEKAGIVGDLQRRGERVAFVGDGINDAPALAQADLGIAVMQASDVAAEAADILLLKSGLEAVPEALGLAAATLRTIRQNLFWAFFYNTAAIPLAAVGWLPPVACAAAMALSDLFVIGNALRLLRWRRRITTKC